MFYEQRCDNNRSWTHWMGRHHGGRGFGHFAAGFLGGPGRGGGGFRTGRKLAAADLQLLILALLAEKPAHGYELIKALEERSGGFYTPSPGMIYPALTYLDEIGYATVEADGTKKLYRATEAGLRHFAQNRTAAEAMLDELQRIGSKMDRVRQVFAGIEGADDIADDGDARGPEDLHAARRALKRALHHAVIDTPEDAKRIAAILRRAADEILGK